MNKLTKKQIRQIVDRTPAKLKGSAVGDGAIVEPLGYYAPADANWSYVAGWMKDGTLVVVRYGQIM